MKVTHESPDLLVLEAVPWLLCLMLAAGTLTVVGVGLAQTAGGEWRGALVALFGLGFGGALLAAFARRTRLVLDRRAGIAELKRRTVLGLQVQSWPLVRVEKAVVEESRSGKRSTRRAALVLRGGGAEPIDPVFSSGKGAGRTVAVLNRWLGAGG